MAEELVSFARKYRPRTFKDYMGESIRKLLQKRMSSPELYPHTVLMYGTKGCGKTTAARLLAKEMLCLNKVDGYACGVCAMCEEIDEKLIMSEAGMEVLNVRELDIAADNTKAAIEDALDWALEDPVYPAKHKVLILDECHMATPQSQNRLLKITEEPPAFLHMIFCTTDPDKMIGTLKDRCELQIKVQKADPDELVEKLLYGCEKEGIRTSKAALRVIVNNCDRNPRDSWNKLEAVAKNNDNEVTLETVSKEIGGVETQIYMEYFQASNSGLEDILKVTNKIRESGTELYDFIKGLTRFTLACINIKFGLKMNDYPKDFISQVGKFFKEYNSEDFDMLLQIVEYANTSILQASNSPEMAELMINNTALRIGKIKLLSIGLQNEAQKSLLENQKGNRESVEKLKQEQSSMNSTASGKEKVQGEILQSVFGAKVKEVKPGVKIDIIDDDENEAEDTKGLSEDDLMDFLGI